MGATLNEDQAAALANSIQTAINGTATELGRPLTTQEKLAISDRVKNDNGITSNFSAPIPGIGTQVWEAFKTFSMNVSQRSGLNGAIDATTGYDVNANVADQYSDYNPNDSLTNTVEDAGKVAGSVATATGKYVGGIATQGLSGVLQGLGFEAVVFVIAAGAVYFLYKGKLKFK